ncbi:major capsid protein [Caproiciproducens faecalis]|uniref:Phage capsid protein n=1 Tax=Caproiciproducens faecalis TaxID=2820301 RepID=A0ABS7DM99_9FIRM|nr:phage capsid protein [Caproiciproducens faecalis]MBW7572434.1 phage capsid protein [Caproiciproducens faecalis]
MAVTLQQAKLNAQDDIQKGVIDEFRKSSYILDNITFDNAVTPGTNGATLTYGYTRLITQPTAAFRAINTEYTSQEVTKDRFTVELKPFGGSFAVDRIVANTGGLVDEVNLQVQQKVKAAKALFHDTIINGDSAINVNSFDGLNKAVTGSTTEYAVNKTIDLSSTSAVDTNYKQFLDMLDEFLSNLDAAPTFLGGNSKLITKIKSVARRAGYLTQSEDAFGRKVDAYDGIPLVDLGAKVGSNDPVVSIVDTRKPDGTNAVTGLTDLYAARLALDGFHAVSLANQDLVKIWLPDFSTSGAVKTGEVEMVAAVALKATKSAGVFRNIKVI